MFPLGSQLTKLTFKLRKVNLHWASRCKCVDRLCVFYGLTLVLIVDNVFTESVLICRCPLADYYQFGN